MNNRIEIDPNICHGQPCIKGTRIMVWQVLDMLKGGQGEKEIKDAFPHLTGNHIKAALDYASSLMKEGYAILPTNPNI